MCQCVFADLISPQLCVSVCLLILSVHSYVSVCVCWSYQSTAMCQCVFADLISPQLCISVSVLIEVIWVINKLGLPLLLCNATCVSVVILSVRRYWSVVLIGGAWKWCWNIVFVFIMYSYLRLLCMYNLVIICWVVTCEQSLVKSQLLRVIAYCEQSLIVSSHLVWAVTCCEQSLVSD